MLCNLEATEFCINLDHLQRKKIQLFTIYITRPGSTLRQIRLSTHLAFPKPCLPGVLRFYPNKSLFCLHQLVAKRLKLWGKREFERHSFILMRNVSMRKLINRGNKSIEYSYYVPPYQVSKTKLFIAHYTLKHCALNIFH